MSWTIEAASPPCEQSRQLARARQQILTKPAGSLGRLEEIAEQFAAWQACVLPDIERIGIRVFAADHGISRRGVSAFPGEVTRQMIGNFSAGGAAISVLGREMGADFAVVNMGTFAPVPAAPGLEDISLMPGTADFSEQAAMSEAVMEAALAAGRDQVSAQDWQLFIAGDMGIGNTSSAAAILGAILGRSASEVTGRGTGVDDATLAAKCALIDSALQLHAEQLYSPLGVLRCVGGLEIAAICGAYIHSAQLGIPIMLDGFIATAAALLACRINPSVRSWMIAGHCSAEAAHHLALESLQLEPILDLEMRLGEGSGAAVAVSILRSALALHRQMASFADAGVSESD